MSLVSSINIAQQALAVNQAAITVTSNNIANIDNENYSKLRVNLAESINYTPSAGNAVSVANSLSGVKITDVERYANSYLQKYYWSENSTYNYLNQYTTIAANIEDLVNELNDTGLSKSLDKFYLAVDSLNDNPSDITARQSYLSAAENLCSTFNNYSQSLSDIQSSLVGDYNVSGDVDNSEIAGYTGNVNTLLDQLATVNFDIIKTNSGETSSSALKDQRDAIISKLTMLIPVDVQENDNGTMNVSLGSHKLVSGKNVVGYLSAVTGTETEPAVIRIIDPKDSTNILAPNVNEDIDSGKIGAILDACGNDPTKLTVSGVLAGLNTLASSFADIMNTIQLGDPENDNSVAMCMTADGKSIQASTNSIFVSDSTTNLSTGINAANIQINSNVINDPYQIAAARLTETQYTDFVATGKHASDTGNNSNSTIMVESRNTSYSGVGSLGTATIEGYLSNLVLDAGTKVESLNSDFKNQGLILTEVESNLSAATGVNLDEELTDLIKFQRAYQAAARLFSVCNELMDSLMSLGK